MIRSILLFLFIAFSVASSHGATQMTSQQRRVADEVVGKRIADIQDRIAKSPFVQSNITELAKRKKTWQPYTPALEIARIVESCRDYHHVPVSTIINEKVIDDIIWQYRNPYQHPDDNTSLDRTRHQLWCATALAVIGHPKGVPFIVQALAKVEEGQDHTLWMSLGSIGDERLVPAITKYLDFTNGQYSSAAIACLARSGEKAIPVLQHFLEGNNRHLREKAVDALIQIGKPACIKVLEKYSNSDDPLFKRKIQLGLQRIQCRTIDKIYTPPTLLAEDEARLWHLTELAIFEPSMRPYPDPEGEKPKSRQEAEESLVKIGTIAVGTIQPHLADNTHFDHFDNSGRGEEFFVSDRAANLLLRIGLPAVPCLIDALCSERGFARENAAKVLRHLTGQSFGADYGLWRQWFLQRQNQQKPA